MAFSYVQYTGDDSTTLFNVPFAYILKEHVKLYEDGVENAAFMWNSDTVISISPAPASGVTVRIVRETPVDSPLVDYVDGTVLTEQSLDLNTQQMLFISQEAKDKADNSITPNTGGQWDGQSLRGEDFADPANLQDLATKHYVDTGMESEVAAAAASAASAASSATSASSHATDANTYRGEALSHKNAAAAAQTAAETAETNTASSETNAANSASAAATSATNAAGSAANAVTEASNAAASAAAAQTSKNGADTAKTGAQTAEANAASSATAAANSATAAATSETNAAASAVAASTAIAQAGDLTTLKNKVINGDFRVVERGGSLVNLNSGGILSQYFTDRWKGVIWSADADFDNQGTFFFDPRFNNYCDMNVRTNNVVASCEQNLEDCRTLAGKTVTLSMLAKAPDADTNCQLRLRQYWGDSSADDSTYHYKDITVTQANGWQWYDATFTLEDSSGKDVQANHRLVVQIYFDTGQTGRIHFTCVQLEEGNTRTSHERRSLALEHMLCWRYFYKVRAIGQVYDDGVNGATTGNKAVTAQLCFPSMMRVVPTGVIETEHSVNNGVSKIGQITTESAHLYLESDGAASGQKRKTDCTMTFDADY